MTTKSDRREAARAWRDRPIEAGIYCFRGAGQVWVGASMDLTRIENRIRFTLRIGDNRMPGLQTAWSHAQGDGFVFEVLETFDAEISAMTRERLLKDRAAEWCDKLGATRV